MTATVKLPDQAIEALRLASMEVDRLRALNAELVAIACGPLSNAETRALARAAIAKAKSGT